jgi:hypothetical protein
VLQEFNGEISIATLVSRFQKKLLYRASRIYAATRSSFSSQRSHSSSSNSQRRSANSDSRQVHCYLWSACWVHVCCLNTCAWMLNHEVMILQVSLARVV